MTTVSEAASRLEAGLFVGRERELASFEQWLVEDRAVPELLNVSGRGGVGKTALLHAFSRIALEHGKPAILVDARESPTTPEGFLSVLTHMLGSELDDFATRLNQACPLIMLDSFEELDALGRYVQDELLPRLDTRVKVVIAGRHPLSRAWNRSDRWSQILRPLRLEGFSDGESREYLARRGVDQPDMVRRIAGAACHNPLALSLATDMVQQFDVRDFDMAPEWHLAVRSLAQRLLYDTSDPQLRELLEAAAVVHQFDESTLAATSGKEDVAAAFDQLCRLSIVKPSARGLQLHDDVRRHVAADLSWRQPGRYHLLRTRALAHYRGRLRTAAPADREWLAVECLSLWGNALIQQIFFDPEQTEGLRIEPRRPADDEDIRRLYLARTAVAPELGGEPLVPPEGDRAFLDAILNYPGSRIRTVRDEGDRIIGFSAVLPVCRESIALVDLSSAMAPLLHAWWSPSELARLPEAANDATSFYLCNLVHDEQKAGPARAALLRDFSGLLATGGTYLCSSFLPSYKLLLETVGFSRVPGAHNQAWGATHPVDGYVLDLSIIGFERWIEAMIGGVPLPRLLDADVLERELRAALIHWGDSDWLGRSPLLALLEIPSGPMLDRPQQLRQKLRGVLTAARDSSAADKQVAYVALELAYLGQSGNRKQAARKLSISRATFYRLVSRGIRGLAETLARPN